MFNFMKIRLVGAKWLHSDRWKDERKDGRTDMRKLIVFFYNFVKAPKTEFHFPGYWK